jgi:uncharacterized protein (TIGR00369 family)
MSPRKSRTSDVLRAMEEFSPFNKLLGIRGERLEPGRVVMSLAVREDFIGDPWRPALHGGIISTLVDTAGGAAAWSALKRGQSVSTIDLRVDYLEPGRLDAPLRAVAEVARKGSRVCHVRVSVSQGDRLVAQGSGVYAIHGVLKR